MITNKVPKQWLNYIVVFLVAALALSLLMGNSGLFTVVGLLLVARAMLYLRQQENVSERDVARRIKAEYPAESQQHVREIYEHMKIKEMEGLFQKILDDAKGDVAKVERLASVAESVGWKAFLENHW
jgi:hypothetical protein